MKLHIGTIGEGRRGSIGVLAFSPSCGSCALEPKDSQLEGARSISVDPVAASAEVAKSAGITIAARPFGKVLARTRRELTMQLPFPQGPTLRRIKVPQAAAS